MDGESAAHMVDDLRAAARLEAAARGRVVRRIADLYAYAAARRGDAVHGWMHRLASSGSTQVATGSAGPAGPAEQCGRAESIATALAQSDPDLILRDVAVEVSVALMLPAGTARAVVEEALVLAGDLPEALDALESGQITWAHARLVMRNWRALMDGAPTIGAVGVEPAGSLDGHDDVPVTTSPGECRRQAEQLVGELLTRAPHTSVAQLGDFARRRRARLGSSVHRRACAAARRHRNVWVTPADDGLAHLNAVLDAPTALSIQTRLDNLVSTLDDDHRLVGEKRADLLGDLLLDGELPEDSGIPRGIRGQVSITVPAADLVIQDPDLHGDPAYLQGYGPISPGTLCGSQQPHPRGNAC